jgi:aspartyl-tRNA(Asn)/glutamyl-tRNA(Gln) amidotransferase subunit C
MSVDLDQAARIAALARLHLAGEELDHITQEMNQVLEYVEELKSLEVEDVRPDGTDPLAGEGDTTRGPEAETPDALGIDLDAFSPDSREGFFIVPPLPGVHAEEAE